MPLHVVVVEKKVEDDTDEEAPPSTTKNRRASSGGVSSDSVESVRRSASDVASNISVVCTKTAHKRERKAYIDFELEDAKETYFFASWFPYPLSTLNRKILRFERQYKRGLFDNVYYTRELLIRSLGGRRVELLTITAKTDEDDNDDAREPNVSPHLFPKDDDADRVDYDRDFEKEDIVDFRAVRRVFSRDVDESVVSEESTYRLMSGGCGLAAGKRPLLRHLKSKPTVLITCRVHPGETPAQYLLDGALDLLLHPTHPVATALRRNFVFKVIPVLNPDGVVLGHHRLDTRGKNLNRCYHDPSPLTEPTVYAAKEVAKLAASSWNGSRLDRTRGSAGDASPTRRVGTSLMLQLRRLYDANAPIPNAAHMERVLIRHFSVEKRPIRRPSVREMKSWMRSEKFDANNSTSAQGHLSFHNFCSFYNHFVRPQLLDDAAKDENGLLLHIDFHAHANKTGIFVFGNHHGTEQQRVRNALYPWLLSKTCALFEFESCDFSAENMTSISEGESRLGTGRVAIYRATGAVNVYTLETHFQHTKREPALSRIEQYRPKHWRDVGMSSMHTILDFSNVNNPRRSDHLPKTHGECEEIVRELLRKKQKKGSLRHRKPRKKI